MSNIGQHNVGKIFTSLRATVGSAFRATYHSKTEYSMPFTKPTDAPEGLAPSPRNPYRKRPVKLIYDKNDFHMFRLPSEKAFLLGSYDYNDLFGARQGINHSPHIRAQMNLDNNLAWGYLLFLLGALVIENKRTHKFGTLRENLYNSDMGKFSPEDFN